MPAKSFPSWDTRCFRFAFESATLFFHSVVSFRSFAGMTSSKISRSIPWFSVWKCSSSIRGRRHCMSPSVPFCHCLSLYVVFSVHRLATPQPRAPSPLLNAAAASATTASSRRVTSHPCGCRQNAACACAHEASASEPPWRRQRPRPQRQAAVAELRPRRPRARRCQCPLRQARRARAQRQLRCRSAARAQR